MLDFPNPKLDQNYSEPGILGYAKDFSPETLLAAYSSGIFPWPIDANTIPWCCPEERAILVFNEMKINDRLARYWKNCLWRLTFNKAFEKVITECALIPRTGQQSTWITKEMITAYTELNQLGYAHSAEVWEKDELIAGIYGVGVNGIFSAESMFHKKSNGSKVAIISLTQKLKSIGLEWMDIQTPSNHMTAFGAKTILRKDFLSKIDEAFLKIEKYNQNNFIKLEF